MLHIRLLVLFATIAILPSVCLAADRPDLRHDPDRPRLAVYGGIGLYPLGDGRWTGYQVTEPEQVDLLVDRCADNGVVQISAHLAEEYAGIGTFDVRYEPANGLINRLVNKAHERNVRVYADLPVFAHIAMDHEFTETHPYAFTRSFVGEPDTHMLSPAYPEVREYKRNVLMSFLREYPVDGVHLDFIRFPYYTHDLRVGYCKHGYDAPILRAYRQLKGLAAGYTPATDEEAWVDFRASYVTLFIRELRETMQESGHELPIAVYNSGIYGREDSRRTVLQDWRVWNRERLVDEHHPMFLMTGGTGNLVLAVKSLMVDKHESTTVFGPIFLAEGYHQIRPTPEAVRDAARRMIMAGCDGLWFCRASEIEEFGLWPVVKEISGWSISKIRTDFSHPDRVNLLVNGALRDSLTGWRAEPASAVTLEPDGDLVIRRDVSNEVMVAQAITFEPLSYMPVASLDVTLDVWGDTDDLMDGIRVEVDLAYHNGEKATKSIVLPPVGPETVSHRFRVLVDTDFKDRILERATLRIVASPGEGRYMIRDLSVERDTVLHSRGHL